MAKKRRKPAPAPTLVRTLAGLQRQGKQLATRLDRDLRKFVRRTRTELTKDAKSLRRQVTHRVQDVTRDLDGRATAARRRLEKRLAALEGGVRSRLNVASSAEIAALKQQLGAIGRRVEGVEQRLAELTEELHDQLAPERG